MYCTTRHGEGVSQQLGGAGNVTWVFCSAFLGYDTIRYNNEVRFVSRPMVIVISYTTRKTSTRWEHLEHHGLLVWAGRRAVALTRRRPGGEQEKGGSTTYLCRLVAAGDGREGDILSDVLCGNGAAGHTADKPHRGLECGIDQHTPGVG